MVLVRKTRTKLRRTFLKEWREHRHLTQEQAAERLDMDRSNLSRVERGEIPYSQALLEAAAVAYDCEPWDLLNVNPLKEGEVVDLTRLMKQATPEQRAEIIGYARGRIGSKH
jgi:transcriptional regulator with XRE-family HTH domain